VCTYSTHYVALYPQNGLLVQGFWYPEGDNVKIPVAIKVLQDGTASRGLLDEARIMASVLHPCCVHVLAVCLAAQVISLSVRHLFTGGISGFFAP